MRRLGFGQRGQLPGIGLVMHRGSLQYWQKVKNIFGSSLLAYYPFYTGPIDISGNSKDGIVNNPVAFGGVGIGMSLGVSGYVTLPQTLMDANLGEFTIAGYVNMTTNSWNDGVSRYMFYLAGADANNRIYIAKLSMDGRLAFTYIANGTNNTLYSGPIKHTERLCLALSVSKTNERMRFFLNGIPSFYSVNLGSFVGVTNYLRAGNNAGTNWINNLHDLVFIDREITEIEARELAGYSGSITHLVGVDGDSRSNEKSWLQSTYPTLKASFGNVGLGLWGISGQGVSTMITNAAANIDTKLIPGGDNRLVVWGGVNDAPGVGASGEVIYTRLQTYCLARKAAGWNKVIVCTEIDAQDVARNTVDWHGTMWSDLNTRLLSNHSWADGLADLGSNASLQDATNTTYFNADRVHLTEAGNDVVASIIGPVVAAAL